jgi:hypothetical protein
VTCLAGAAAPTVVPAPAQAPRSDGTVAHFVVDSVESFDKDVFRASGSMAPPPARRWGWSPVAAPSTVAPRSYLDNVVVFASPR